MGACRPVVTRAENAAGQLQSADTLAASPRPYGLPTFMSSASPETQCQPQCSGRPVVYMPLAQRSPCHWAPVSRKYLLDDTHYARPLRCEGSRLVRKGHAGVLPLELELDYLVIYSARLYPVA